MFFMYLLNRSECELQKRSCHLKTHILITDFAPCKCKYLVNSICNTFSNRFTKSYIAYNKNDKLLKKLQTSLPTFLIEFIWKNMKIYCSKHVLLCSFNHNRLTYNIMYVVKKNQVQATFWCEITLIVLFCH